MTLEGNNQVWVLTDYGKQRVTEATASQTEQITISTVKLGDANGSYYVPTGAETALKRQVGVTTGYPVYKKQLLKDENEVENIVSFSAYIQEVTGGFQVYEIGLYESVPIAGGTELKLFALGVGEPINMPEVTKGYDIEIDFELRLKSTNLASVYDKIYLDPKNDFLHEGDIEELSNVVLYVEGNLMEQISSNSHILGLNRAQQLSELIDSTLFTYSNAAGMNILSNLCNFTTTESNIHGYWLFNQTPWYGAQTLLRDFSYHGNNLALNTVASAFDFSYTGVVPTLAVTGTNSYKVPADSSFHLMNTLKTDDSPFTIFIAFNPATSGTINTLFAQSNYFTAKHNFELVKTSTESIKFTLFTDASNYVSWETAPSVITGGMTVVAVRYNGNKTTPSFTIAVNGTIQTLNKSETGTYAGLTDNLLDTTSYVLEANTGNAINNVNSNVSFLSLIKESLSDAHMRGINQSLLAYIGKNVYYGL